MMEAFRVPQEEGIIAVTDRPVLALLAERTSCVSDMRRRRVGVGRDGGVFVAIGPRFRAESLQYRSGGRSLQSSGVLVAGLFESSSQKFSRLRHLVRHIALAPRLNGASENADRAVGIARSEKE